MSIVIRKIFGLFLVCTLIFGLPLFLTACGSNSGGNNNNSSGDNSNENGGNTVDLTLDNYEYYLVCSIVATSTGSYVLPTVYSLNVSAGISIAIYDNVVITYKYNDAPGAGGAEHTVTLALTIGGIGSTPSYATRPQIVGVSGSITIKL
jgi:hypothetical protein